ncbi:MAG: hypothetical protein ACK529_03100, partial [Alphaproteobacteria bacterium]
MSALRKEKSAAAIGIISQVIGPVVDVKFMGGVLPAILNALEAPVDGRRL